MRNHPIPYFGLDESCNFKHYTSVNEGLKCVWFRKHIQWMCVTNVYFQRLMLMRLNVASILNRCQTGFCVANPKNYRTRCRNHFALGLINFMKFDPKTFHDEISIFQVLLVHKGDSQGFRPGLVWVVLQTAIFITDLWLHDLTGVKVHVSQAALYMVETPKTKRHVIINFFNFHWGGVVQYVKWYMKFFVLLSFTTIVFIRKCDHPIMNLFNRSREGPHRLQMFPTLVCSRTSLDSCLCGALLGFTH